MHGIVDTPSDACGRTPNATAPRCAIWALVLVVCGCGKPGTPSPAVQAAEAKRLGVPATFADAHGHRFALVPSTEFEMGSGRDRHTVRLTTPFYLQTGWVTTAQRRAWRAEAPDGPWTHDEARAYADWLTERDDYFRYRLPSEAEWVCAAQAQLGIDDLERRATWCSDWFAPLPDYMVGDPTGPARGTRRVIRGDGPRRGASPDAARAAVRLVAEVGYGNPTLGIAPVTFRTVDTSSGRPVPRPGYALRMISVHDRLADRQVGLPIRWRELGRAPVHIRMVPGRYYVHSYEVREGREVRSRETKFDIPGASPFVDVELPDPSNRVPK